MNKQEFIAELRVKLSGLPKSDVEERLSFYSEMIDDRTEEGLSEEEAIGALGSTEEIVLQIIEESPFKKIARERIKKKRRLGVWEVVLISLGAPIWLSLIISAIAVVISLYASLWGVVVSFWAAFISLAVSSVGVISVGIGSAVVGELTLGVIYIGAGLFAAGLAIFTFFGCKLITRWAYILAKKLVVGIKKSFIKKEEA